MCYASLPGSMNVLITIGAAFVLFVLLALVGQVAMNFPIQNVETRALITFVGSVVLVIAFAIAIKKLGRKFGQQAMFVYDGGIHLNESVSYVVSYGRWMQFCTGTRSVSLPWRVLENFSATEMKHKGNVNVEASLKLPDGRMLRVNTQDGNESAKAIEALLDNLG